jgi:hypothetical protein
MFKSKHSGWTWELKRTPFGGGNPLSGVTDSISSALGTDGGDGGLLGGLADIDPGPAIGSGLAEVDTFVNREVPGGWVLPAALAAAYATGYIDPSLFASEAAAAAGAEAGAGAIATEAGQTAFFEALASGASSAEAVNTALAVESLASGAASYLTPELMGPTYGELGFTGVEGGFAGPTYAELGYTGLNQAEAIAAADAAAQGLSAKDVLTNANRAKKIADLLNQSNPQAKINPRNIPTASQWTQQAAQNFAQATPEQFGGLYQMNKNPFTFQNPLASALAGKEKQPGIYDVSGTQGQALNTQNQTANLLRMFG